MAYSSSAFCDEPKIQNCCNSEMRSDKESKDQELSEMSLSQRRNEDRGDILTCGDCGRLGLPISMPTPTGPNTQQVQIPTPNVSSPWMQEEKTPLSLPCWATSVLLPVHGFYWWPPWQRSKDVAEETICPACKEVGKPHSKVCGFEMHVWALPFSELPTSVFVNLLFWGAKCATTSHSEKRHIYHTVLLKETWQAIAIYGKTAFVADQEPSVQKIWHGMLGQYSEHVRIQTRKDNFIVS